MLHIYSPEKVVQLSLYHYICIPGMSRSVDAASSRRWQNELVVLASLVVLRAATACLA